MGPPINEFLVGIIKTLKLFNKATLHSIRGICFKICFNKNIFLAAIQDILQ